MRHAILTKDGQIVFCEFYEWAAWFEKSPDRVIAHDQRLGLRLSTVFLGLGPPLWFETMLFGPYWEHELEDRTYWAGQDLEVRHYSTLEEAKAGHAEILEWLLERTDLSTTYQLQLCYPKETEQETDERIINRSLPAEGT